MDCKNGDFVYWTIVFLPSIIYQSICILNVFSILNIKETALQTSYGWTAISLQMMFIILSAIYEINFNKKNIESMNLKPFCLALAWRYFIAFVIFYIVVYLISLSLSFFEKRKYSFEKKEHILTTITTTTNDNELMP